MININYTIKDPHISKGWVITNHWLEGAIHNDEKYIEIDLFYTEYDVNTSEYKFPHWKPYSILLSTVKGFGGGIDIYQIDDNLSDKKKIEYVRELLNNINPDFMNDHGYKLIKLIYHKDHRRNKNKIIKEVR